MAKVIQIIEVNSDGWKVRLSDGSVVEVKTGGESPHIGEEIPLQFGAPAHIEVAESGAPTLTVSDAAALGEAGMLTQDGLPVSGADASNNLPVDEAPQSAPESGDEPQATDPAAEE